ncbi:MAG: hypothetical protein JNK72_20395 [Myxococcales bacterium]|nr:hypothetical protein [Myxococcales bacterium]
MSQPPIAVLNEHPEWQKRLYAELTRRGLAYVELPLHDLHFNPAALASPYKLVVNRASPSAWKRDHASAIFFAQSALAYYAEAGARVINGSSAYRLETSKALQAMLLERLAIRTPRTRVANGAASVRAAAAELAYPIVVKPNIGGSGAGIVRFDDRDALEAWLGATPSFGIDGTVLVQEFHPARDGHIVRVEMLGQRHLYSVKIWPDTTDFNLCPADICQVPAKGEAAAEASGDGSFELCVVSAPAKKLRIERHEESPEVIAIAQKIAQAGKLDVCGIEYLVSTRDGQRYYYDINALSNFVRDAEEIVGFDPTRVFVDSLEAELKLLG